MSFEAERRAVESTFATDWSGTPYSAVVVQYENTPMSTFPAEYLYVRVLSGTGKAAEISGTASAFNRYNGVVQIDIIVGEDTGTARARVLADAAAGILRRRQITDSAGGRLTFRVPSIKQIGPIQGKYRFVVSIPFQRDIRE